MSVRPPSKPASNAGQASLLRDALLSIASTCVTHADDTSVAKLRVAVRHIETLAADSLRHTGGAE
jgi:hypothetical protein